MSEDDNEQTMKDNIRSDLAYMISRHNSNERSRASHEKGMGNIPGDITVPYDPLNTTETIYFKILKPTIKKVAEVTKKTIEAVEPTAVRFSEVRDTGYNASTGFLTIKLKDIENMSTKELSEKISGEVQKAHAPKKKNIIQDAIGTLTILGDAKSVSPRDTIPSPLANMQPQKGGREGIA